MRRSLRRAAPAEEAKADSAFSIGPDRLRNPDQLTPVGALTSVPRKAAETVDATFLLWLPPVVQGVSDLLNVIECGLLSGLFVRHFQKPPAGMVISGSGPNLLSELASSRNFPGFPYPDRFDHAPIRVVDFSHLLTGVGRLRSASDHAATPTSGHENLPVSSAWPTSCEPSCLPVRSPPTFAVCEPASALAMSLALAIDGPPSLRGPLRR